MRAPHRPSLVLGRKSVELKRVRSVNLSNTNSALSIKLRYAKFVMARYIVTVHATNNDKQLYVLIKQS